MRVCLCRDCLHTWFLPDGTVPPSRCPNCGFGRTISHGELRALGIAHVDCDSFYASVEKRDHPELRDKPLLIGGTGARSVVATACYLARAFGCRSAMPMYKARELCPQAVVLPADHAKYRRVSAEIHTVFRSYTDVIEPIALDEAFLDLRQCDDVPEALCDIALRIEQDIGITVSVGLSYCKYLAKLASDLDKPRGFAVIGRAEARRFLAPRPIRDIYGVGPAMERRLIADGFATIGAVQAAGELELKTRYGQHGREIWHLARGDDPRPVVCERDIKSVSTETTFTNDIADAETLLAALRPLAEKVEARLRHAGVAASVVQLKLKTRNFRLLTRQTRLSDPTQRAETLLSAVEPLVRREANGRLFRLVGLGGEVLTSAQDADPPDLFAPLIHP